jgi:hypothetical protein
VVDAARLELRAEALGRVEQDLLGAEREAVGAREGEAGEDPVGGAAPDEGGVAPGHSARVGAVHHAGAEGGRVDGLVGHVEEAVRDREGRQAEVAAGGHLNRRVGEGGRKGCERGPCICTFSRGTCLRPSTPTAKGTGDVWEEGGEGEGWTGDERQTANHAPCRSGTP